VILCTPFEAKQDNVGLDNDLVFAVVSAIFHVISSCHVRTLHPILHAAIGCVTLWAIPVPGVEIVQDAASVQPIVNQRVDDDQLNARCMPTGIAGPSAEQERHERQRQDFVGNAVDMPQRIDDGGSIGFVGPG
jgi:hypothetical protein